MKFKLEIKLDNEAFNAFNGMAIAVMLTDLANKLEGLRLDTRYSGPLLDVNGNKCGNWKVVK